MRRALGALLVAAVAATGCGSGPVATGSPPGSGTPPPSTLPTTLPTTPATTPGPPTAAPTPAATRASGAPPAPIPSLAAAKPSEPGNGSSSLGRIDAVFDDPRLPGEFRSDVSIVDGTGVVVDAADEYASLDAERQALLAPFLVPPYALRRGQGSGHDQGGRRRLRAVLDEVRELAPVRRRFSRHTDELRTQQGRVVSSAAYLAEHMGPRPAGRRPWRQGRGVAPGSR